MASSYCAPTPRSTPLQAVLRYRDFLQVEELFRSRQGLWHTRPIFHSSDAAIRGHVFCSFLALVLHNEMQERCAQAGSSWNGAMCCATWTGCRTSLKRWAQPGGPHRGNGGGAPPDEAGRHRPAARGEATRPPAAAPPHSALAPRPATA